MTTEERLAAVMQECRKSPTQTPHARFSTALGCLRSHVYDFRLLDKGEWPDVIDRPARWNFAAAAGHAIGWQIESAAERLGAKTQHAVALDRIHGDLDIEWPDEIWDLKWVGDFAWREAKKGPNPKHAAQCNAYAVARQKPRWALIYLPLAHLGKGESLEWIVWPGESDPDQAAREVVARWRTVEEHRKDGTLPDRETEEHACRRLKCIHLPYCRDGAPNP